MIASFLHGPVLEMQIYPQVPLLSEPSAVHHLPTALGCSSHSIPQASQCLMLITGPAIRRTGCNICVTSRPMLAGAWGVSGISRSLGRNGVSDEDLQAQGWLPACLTCLLAQVRVPHSCLHTPLGQARCHWSAAPTMANTNEECS